MPVVKVKYKEYSSFDSVWTFDVKRYHYFRISQYGVVGNCAKYKYYDADSVLVKSRVIKRSAMVSDGMAVNHEKIREYNKEGKLIQKTYSILKERGWSQAIQKEKVIVYGPHHKRSVTRTHS